MSNYIVCIKEDDNKVITKVGIKTQLRNSGYKELISRGEAIKLIEQNDNFFSAIKNSKFTKENDEDYFLKAAKVSVVSVSGKKYIRTDKNDTAKDNLDNLKKCTS